MPAPRKDAQAELMYAMYLEGFSLAQVGQSFRMTRQSVFISFQRRGWSLRTRVCKPTITYDGDTFAPDPDGYYRRTHGDRRHLHLIVWEDNHGPIPQGYEIHHSDKNKSNNDPSNLECLTPSEHGLRHKPYQPIPVKFCALCGQQLVRRREPSGHVEPPSRIAKRIYCNCKCMADHRRGKTRGWTALHG